MFLNLDVQELAEANRDARLGCSEQ